MSKFKVGDKVRYIPCRGMRSWQNITLTEFHRVTGNWHGDDPESGNGSFREDELEHIYQSPVRTVTRKEIIPGVYGKVVVVEDDGEAAFLKFLSQYGGESPSTFAWSADELRDASRTLAELADALDGRND